jgi:hypothetical protein
VSRCDALDDAEADVVSRVLVFGAGVAEANDELHVAA